MKVPKLKISSCSPIPRRVAPHVSPQKNFQQGRQSNLPSPNVTDWRELISKACCKQQRAELNWDGILLNFLLLSVAGESW